jgi:hypothetical protein
VSVDGGGRRGRGRRLNAEVLEDGGSLFSVVPVLWLPS